MQKLKTFSLAALLLASTAAVAGAPPRDGIGPFTNGVANANAASGSPSNVYSTDFHAVQVVTGTDPLENPSTFVTMYGKLSTAVNTEPDQNTYLYIPGKVRGPTRGYDYGHNFLIAGHENAGNLAYVTRVNLDVNDPAHRITLLTPEGIDALTHFSRIDGSTYDVFTNSVLVSQEGGAADGGVVEISMKGWPAKVTTRYGMMGQCGLEGVHVDKKGRIYLVEDTGGTGASNDPNDINGANKVARQPNSYVFRFVPYDKRNLDAGGRLEALQVRVGGKPLTFGGTSAQQVFDDVWSEKQLQLHSGASFPTKWVTIHDTAESTASFDCNATARAAGATPFKRPENGAFKPDGTFQHFYFTITGDTNNLAGAVPGLAARGAWGGVFELTLTPTIAGSIRMVALGDAAHNSFDNITWGDSGTFLVTEDRGDTLHDQLNALDSIWAYPLGAPNAPLRVLAQGRDVSASGAGVEDNEPTGVFVSNGGKFKNDQYGSADSIANARGFFTQQHGDNTTWELVHN
ncbi:MAG TPA: alkaline phosphatase PhoX [Rhizomicrobium sp.]|nr:alkaline phosphatase PhoX [Rhizomicrobium sp.]